MMFAGCQGKLWLGGRVMLGILSVDDAGDACASMPSRESSIRMFAKPTQSNVVSD